MRNQHLRPLPPGWEVVDTISFDDLVVEFIGKRAESEQ
jgi:hypothetical protein